MVRMSLFVVLLGVGLCAVGGEGTAQDKDARATYRPAEGYKCRIINETGSDLRLIVVGFDYSSTLPFTLKNGRHYDRDILKGERVFVAYDDFDETLVTTKKVLVDKRLKITLTKSDIAAAAWAGE